MTEVYDIKLPKKLQDVLEVIVKLAEKHDSLAISYSHAHMAAGNRIYNFSLYNENKRFSEMHEDVIFSLGMLGLICDKGEGENGGTVFVTQLAFEWMNYRRKGWIGKTWFRLWRTAKGATPLLVAALSIILSILLALVQIYQALNKP